MHDGVEDLLVVAVDALFVPLQDVGVGGPLSSVVILMVVVDESYVFAASDVFKLVDQALVLFVNLVQSLCRYKILIRCQKSK